MKNLYKNYAYEYGSFQNFLKKVLINQRKKFYKIFCREINFNSKSKILDVGTTNTKNDYDNLLIRYYPFKKNLTCLSNQSLDLVKKKFPQIKTKLGDGRKMLIPSNKFDVVFSNAVIEHVGSNLKQLQLIKECLRVSKKYVLIITPYRYFPIEMHTKIPLLHFLPKKIFRIILIFFGEKFLSKEKNLNLMSEKDLLKICLKLEIKKFKIFYSYFFGLKSNLILKIKI